MMRFVILAVACVAFLPALAIGLAGPGARFGLWEYGDGFAVMRQAALPAMVAAGAALVAFLIALFTERGLALLALVAALAAGAAASVPIQMRAQVNAYPFIHDVTTDFDNPPAIAVAADLPRNNPPDYVGAEPAPRSDLTVAEAQREAFPDIKPMIVDGDVAEVAEKARGALKSMGMEILADRQDAEGAVLEAAHTSLWYGFVDDFIVRITPVDGGARVDVRSKSRVGGSDLGANAKRVRAFFERMQ